jgi:Tfp pilus assembly protein PilX
LIVVLGLLLIVSMVTAYASRNLLFEQRSSANLYRATQAHEAAEAALEWAIGLLNAGRVDDACKPATRSGAAPLRDRFLHTRIDFNDPQGSVTFAPVASIAGGASGDLAAACVRTQEGWSCDCTGGTAIALLPADASASAFRITFGAGGGPGSFLVDASACTTTDDRCLVGKVASNGNARASVRALVALAPAMPTGPAAPLTVRGTLSLGAHAWRLVNADAATNGIAVHAGGAVDSPSAVLYSAPGSPPARAVVDRDATLAGLTAERLFVTLFGVDEATFARSPTTLPFGCDGDCGQSLRDLVLANPGLPVWIAGDLRIDGDVVVGTPELPVLLAVGGSVTLASPGARIHGVLYARSAQTTLIGDGGVHGAVIAAGNLTGAGTLTVVYDPSALARVRLAQGAVVRVPGGWRDF